VIDRAVGARHAAVDFQDQRLNALEIVGMADDQTGRCIRQLRIIIDTVLKRNMMPDVWIDRISWWKALSEPPPLPFGKLSARKPQAHR
jgi:hypothetical protein